MIVLLRGSSGSGKTYVATQFLEWFGPQEPVYQEGWNKVKPKLVGHRLANGPTLAGNYTYTVPGAKCGGIDGLRPFEAVHRLIEELADEGRGLLVEGLLWSVILGRVVQLSERYGDQFVIATLDTPLVVCRERVLARNGGKPFNTNVMTQHWLRTHSLAGSFVAAGIRHVFVSYHEAPVAVARLFGLTPPLGAG